MPPTGPLTASETVNRPAELYVYATVVFSVFVVPPSPNVQDRFVIVPVDVSVNVTSNGTRPLVGVPLKLAMGMVAPAPITGFVESPMFVAKTTLSVKLPVIAGVKLTTTFVELRVATENGLPETIENGAPPTTAVPLSVTPLPLVTTKLSCAVVPVRIAPKSRLAGVTTKLKEVTALSKFTAVLFARFGSGLNAPTCPIFVKTPTDGAFTRTLIVAAVPLVISWRLQTTRPKTSVTQVPWLGVAERNTTLLGGVSVTVTLNATPGPAFVTVIVYVTLLPTSTGLGEANLLIIRSASLPAVQQLPPSLISTPSINQPLPPPLASVTQRQRS